MWNIGFAALGVLLCLVFKAAIFGQLLHNEIDFAEWDMNTLTLDDFTVEMMITD